VIFPIALFSTTRVAGLPAPVAYAAAVVILVLAIVITAAIVRRAGRVALTQRLTALGSRLGLNPPAEEGSIENALSYLEQVTGAAAEAVAEASSDAIRLRRSLDALPQGVVLCDETGKVVYRNTPANALMTSRHGDALAAHAVTELLEDAWHGGTAERTLDLYGPPRRTLSVRALLIDDGRRSLGVIAMIDDVSERRRLEEVRRDFVANVSHELKTPMGALGLLAETLVAEPDGEVAQRLASRIHTEAFRVSRIIDDLLDLSRIESESTPPREPVLVNLVMAEAVERVRAVADQRSIAVVLYEPEPPVAVVGDRRQLVSAMAALLENAITYSYDESTVTVSGIVTREAADPPSAESSRGEEPSGAVSQIVPSSSHPAVTSMQASESGPYLVGQTAGAPYANPVQGGRPLPAYPGAIAVAAGDGGSRSDPQLPPEIFFGAKDGGPSTNSMPPVPAFPSDPPEVSGAEDGPYERDVVRISVTDHGTGIPARDLERIFERFYRVDHGRSRNTGGTGLGLSIVRHVANNHQGRIEVESREGEGSTFTLVLPLQPDRLP
jgi:two-component system sensor histidine kinase SenX3